MAFGFGIWLPLLNLCVAGLLRRLVCGRSVSCLLAASLLRCFCLVAGLVDEWIRLAGRMFLVSMLMNLWLLHGMFTNSAG